MKVLNSSTKMNVTDVVAAKALESNKMSKLNVPLAVFGCSWAHGYGVNYDQTFGYNLSQKLSSSCYTNMGVLGSSNSRSVLQLMEYVKRTDIALSESIAIFSITTMARDCVLVFNVYTKTFDIVDLMSGNSSYESQCYVSHFSSEENLKFNLQKNILSLQSICRANNIHDYYIDAWSCEDYDMPGIDQTKIFDKSCIELFGFNNTQHYLDTYPNQYIRNCGHPSVHGHQVIADALYNWIVATI
jgi:hypothetical protein